MKILQQRVSGWLAKDVFGKQGSCRNHLMYLHTVVFEQERAGLLWWGSCGRFFPCKESYQNKILAWQCGQECHPYSSPQCKNPCVSFQVTDRCLAGRSHCVKRWEVFAFTHLSGYQAQLIPNTGSQSKEWMLCWGLLVFMPTSLQWGTIKSANHKTIRAGTITCTRNVTIHTS